MLLITGVSVTRWLSETMQTSYIKSAIENVLVNINVLVMLYCFHNEHRYWWDQPQLTVL